MLYALSDAAVGWRVRNTTYRPVAEVSDQIARRDLKLAVEAGLLVAMGERRGRHYVASDRLKQIRDQTREPRPAFDDPFRRCLSQLVQRPQAGDGFGYDPNDAQGGEAAKDHGRDGAEEARGEAGFKGAELVGGADEDGVDG